ncbi:hypothetical protein M378DRAFT_168504 [Amanita muscaria Koide BX008]|uniref:Uncharacterized protein n=1 Tax=Amanita muscaria (strain Koide BX008) TaxID=946122 RepID=A0A0C2WTN0_AMAMK|nr:hypothetical protein M378DRAFT_168504 [Amanita muscaria Koide BX008]
MAGVWAHIGCCERGQESQTQQGLTHSASWPLSRRAQLACHSTWFAVMSELFG